MRAFVFPSRMALAVLLTLAAASCRTPAPPSELEPFRMPAAVQAAQPRLNGAIAGAPAGGTATVSLGSGTSPTAVSGAAPGVRPAGGEDVTLDFADTDIREITRVILGTTLKLNYTIDPNVKGSATIQTNTPIARAALIPTLEGLLNQNGATIVVQGDVYRVVPIGSSGAANAITANEAFGSGTQVVPLRYAAAKDLAKLLEPYVAEGGRVVADAGRNALIVSGNPAVRDTLISLVRAFDVDALAGQSYAIFPVTSGDPAKVAADLEKILQANTDATLAGVIRVFPLERVNSVLVVAQQQRYIDAARRFFALADHAADATARAWHVYYVQNGQSADLENLLQRAFTPNNVTGRGEERGSTAPGLGQATLGGGQNISGFSGNTQSGGGLQGNPSGMITNQNRGTDLPTPPSAVSGGGPPPEALSPSTAETGDNTGNRGDTGNSIRIIANRKNNALLI
jgi:general secretion pathway protein D